MPVTIQNRRARQLFGPDCLFGITDFNGFMGNLAGNYATVTGTLAEVATPFGTGIQVGAAGSYVRFDWRAFAPLTDAPRSIFARFLVPTSLAPGPGSEQILVSWGGVGADRDRFDAREQSGDVGYGPYNDGDTVGTGMPVTGNWSSVGVSNEGTNGGDNIVFLNGVVASGANGAACVTTHTDLYLFTNSGNPGNNGAPENSILQEVLVFNRALSLAEMLHLHNKVTGAA